LLYVNQHNGQFTEEALLRGVALDEEGNALSGMGLRLVITTPTAGSTFFEPNFSDEHVSLYHNRRMER